MVREQQKWNEGLDNQKKWENGKVKRFVEDEVFAAWKILCSRPFHH